MQPAMVACSPPSALYMISSTCTVAPQKLSCNLRSWPVA